jgi:hypothetical protein
MSNAQQAKPIPEWLLHIFYELRSTFLEIGQSIKNGIGRILLLGVIIAIASYIYADAEADSTVEKLSLHFIVELSGAIIVFILLERTVQHVMKKRIHDFDDFPIGEFIEKMAYVNKIRIQDYNLVTLLRSDHGQHRQKFETALEKSISRNGVRVEILLAQPNSYEAKARARTLAKTFGVIYADISDATGSLLTFIDRVKRNVPSAFPENGEARLQLRFFEGRPEFAFYQVGERAYVTFYSETRKSMDSSQLSIPIRSSFGDFLSSTVNKMWDSANHEWTDDTVRDWIKDFGNNHRI